MAIQAYRAVIEHAPDHALPYIRLGAIYRRRSMAVEARRMYEQAAERAGDDPAVLFDLARPLADELSLALGEAAGSALVSDADIPNAGAFPTADGVGMSEIQPAEKEKSKSKGFSAV